MITYAVDVYSPTEVNNYYQCDSLLNFDVAAKKKGALNYPCFRLLTFLCRKHAKIEKLGGGIG